MAYSANVISVVIYHLVKKYSSLFFMFVPTAVPILKVFTGEAFRRLVLKRVYENEHLLYDDVQSFAKWNIFPANL